MNESNVSSKKRVFIVDDHPLVREWLTNLIHQQSDLEVCGEADDAQIAFSAIEFLQPHVVVVDMTLVSSSGLELVKNIKAALPHIATVVLSVHDELTYGERALKAGARGYVTKRDTTKKIIIAIRAVLAGKIYVSDEFNAMLAARMIDGTGAKSNVELLSDRELEVFRMLGEGSETKAIAATLNISIKTVQAYCARIKEKFRIYTGTELLREAIRWVESQAKV
jgi:DNA-binding NarL/FixJ family response regulator